MNNNNIGVKFATTLVLMFYDSAKNLSASNMEDSEEFEELILKLRRMIDVENEEYHKLSQKDLLTCYMELNNNGFNSEVDSRMYRKLVYEKRCRENNLKLDNILLSDVIASKLLIDVLKKVNSIIRSTNNNNSIDSDDSMMLNIHNSINKYDFLTANNHIEALALKYKFNIKHLPSLFFDEIANEFNVDFVNSAKPIFLSYARDSIAEIANLSFTDKYLYAYLSLFELSRIDIILKYLDTSSVDDILKQFDSKYIDSRNQELIGMVKKLVRKRKEELE